MCPGLVFDALFTPETAIYAMTVSSCRFLPLLAMPRLAVGVPLFAILRHQFEDCASGNIGFMLHWSLSSSGRCLFGCCYMVADAWRYATLQPKSIHARQQVTAILGNLVWTSALATGIFFSLGPLGISFWDPGSMWNWKNLYAPSHCAESVRSHCHN